MVAGTATPTATRQLGRFDNGDGTFTGAAVNVHAGQPVIGANTASAAASNTASLPAVAGKTNYVTGVIVTSTAPAATVAGEVTITGLAGGTVRFQLTESSTVGGQVQIFFAVAQVAAGANTAITVNVPAITSGGSTSITILGFVV